MRSPAMEQAGGAKIITVGREKEHGVVLYEAEWMAGGRKHEAEVTADGDLMEREQSIEAKDVPAAVRSQAGTRRAT